MNFKDETSMSTRLIQIQMELLCDALEILECDYIKPDKKQDTVEISFCVNKKNLIISIDIKKNKLVKKQQDYVFDHLFRLLEFNDLIKLTKDNIYEFLTFVNDRHDLLSYCTNCGKSISVVGIGSCKKCQNDFMSVVTDNTITSLYNDDKIAFNMIILSAYACLKHPKKNDIFKPFPSFFNTCEDLQSKTKYSYENFNSLLQIISNCENDYTLKERIGDNDYSFLKFIILTNITNIKSDVLFSGNIQNIFDQKIATNIFEENEVITLQVRHDPLTESKFVTSSPQYLFHGSTLANWYSILRNGIKVFSGTGLMAHGAAHGKGIYLSDNLNVSLSYGADKYCESKLYVIGVVQVLGNKKDYQKTLGIYVLPDENNLVLRYIIILKGTKDLSFITNYFTVKRETEVMLASVGFSVVTQKRINYDYDKISKMAKKYDWIVNNNDNKITIMTDDTSLGISFPKDYPSSPPFVWIIETSRVINGIKILEHGAIVDEELSYNNWKSTTQIHKIVKNIIGSIGNKEIKKVLYNEEIAYKKYIDHIKKSFN